MFSCWHIHPVSPGDIVATIYRLLGAHPHALVRDLTGRPIPISHGGRAPSEVRA